MPELQISEYRRQRISRGTGTPLQHKISPRMKKDHFNIVFNLNRAYFHSWMHFKPILKRKKGSTVAFLAVNLSIFSNKNAWLRSMNVYTESERVQTDGTIQLFF